jgi:two-component system sensor histidine kinase DesK
VVREGTTNVLRHATATTVRLALTRDTTGVTLTLTNDGAGDGPGAVGSGLAGLTERLDEVGGTLRSAVSDGRWTLAAHVDPAVLTRLDEAGSSS